MICQSNPTELRRTSNAFHNIGGHGMRRARESRHSHNGKFGGPPPVNEVLTYAYVPEYLVHQCAIKLHEATAKWRHASVPELGSQRQLFEEHTKGIGAAKVLCTTQPPCYPQICLHPQPSSSNMKKRRPIQTKWNANCASHNAKGDESWNYKAEGVPDLSWQVIRSAPLQTQQTIDNKVECYNDERVPPPRWRPSTGQACFV
mmetsp:Transcript_2078/g.3501  ORF Transcript_2078/g.3501 Transcript_2078/m.3501 type:complete len:202 (-) Transcript_2078:219-824(-)